MVVKFHVMSREPDLETGLYRPGSPSARGTRATPRRGEDRRSGKGALRNGAKPGRFSWCEAGGNHVAFSRSTIAGQQFSSRQGPLPVHVIRFLKPAPALEPYVR